jgi:hypothetical protein
LFLPSAAHREQPGSGKWGPVLTKCDVWFDVLCANHHVARVPVRTLWWIFSVESGDGRKGSRYTTSKDSRVLVEVPKIRGEKTLPVANHQQLR